MANSTELRRYKPGWWSEINRRSNWLLFGTVIAVGLCFIPIIGWAMGVGIFGLMLWKTFGPRPLMVEGDCPACTKCLPIDPKRDDVFACPTCGSVIKVEPDALSLVPISN